MFLQTNKRYESIQAVLYSSYSYQMKIFQSSFFIRRAYARGDHDVMSRDVSDAQGFWRLWWNYEKCTIITDKTNWTVNFELELILGEFNLNNLLRFGKGYATRKLYPSSVFACCTIWRTGVLSNRQHAKTKDGTNIKSLRLCWSFRNALLLGRCGKPGKPKTKLIHFLLLSQLHMEVYSDLGLCSTPSSLKNTRTRISGWALTSSAWRATGAPTCSSSTPPRGTTWPSSCRPRATSAASSASPPRRCARAWSTTSAGR